MAGYSSYVADFRAGANRMGALPFARYGKLYCLFGTYLPNWHMVNAVGGECPAPRGNRHCYTGNAYDGVAPTIAQPLVDVFCAHTGHMVVCWAGCGFYLFSVLVFWEQKYGICDAYKNN